MKEMMWLTDWYEIKGNVKFLWGESGLRELSNSRPKGLYDVIVLVDVVFDSQNGTVSNQLMRLRDYLCDGGNILILTYNRLGLRFFAGAPEAIYNQYFLGLTDYDTVENHATYCRKEWIDILNDTDFGYRFYYPYPEHHHPIEIFSDETINTYDYGRPVMNQAGRRYELFNEQRVAQALSDSGIMQEFAHSFLIELNPRERKKEYTKYSLDRKKIFQIITEIGWEKGQRKVWKKAATQEARQHINRLYQNTVSQNGLRLLKAVKKGDSIIEYPYLKDESLEMRLINILNRGNKEALERYFDDFYLLLKNKAKKMHYGTEQFKYFFGTQVSSKDEEWCKCPINIDMIFDNIYILGKEKERFTETDIIVIDGEWVLDIPVPIKFVFWRALNEFYNRHPVAEDLLPRQNICERYQILPDNIADFQSWNRYFTIEFVGTGKSISEDLSSATDLLSLNDIRWNYGPGRRVNTLVYWKDGEETDYTENKSVYKEAKCLDDYLYSVQYSQREIKNHKKVRIDLQKGHYCKCRIIRTVGIAQLFPRNILKKKSGYDYFFWPEASYEIILEEDINTFELEYEIIDIENELLHDVLVERGNLIAEKATLEHERLLKEEQARLIEQKNVQLLSEKQELLDETERLKEELLGIKQTKIYRIMEKVGGIKIENKKAKS